MTDETSCEHFIATEGSLSRSPGPCLTLLENLTSLYLTFTSNRHSTYPYQCKQSEHTWNVNQQETLHGMSWRSTEVVQVA